jgi:hypothetical protein
VKAVVTGFVFFMVLRDTSKVKVVKSFFTFDLQGQRSFKLCRNYCLFLFVWDLIFYVVCLWGSLHVYFVGFRGFGPFCFYVAWVRFDW